VELAQRGTLKTGVQRRPVDMEEEAMGKQMTMTQSPVEEAVARLSDRERRNWSLQVEVEVEEIITAAKPAQTAEVEAVVHPVLMLFEHVEDRNPPGVRVLPQIRSRAPPILALLLMEAMGMLGGLVGVADIMVAQVCHFFFSSTFKKLIFSSPYFLPSSS